MTYLVERLGHPPDAKLVIINCDDLGMSPSVNDGVWDALRCGTATSASLMVPCPAASDAAARQAGQDIGVHLTLNAEWDRYRWGPLTPAATLTDADGAFPRDVQQVWQAATTADVESECHAQVERALSWELDVSHLDSHIHVLQSHARFFAIYLNLARTFRLPMRLTGTRISKKAEAALRSQATEAGVVVPDHVVHLDQMGTWRIIRKAFAELRPGVTEIYAHPAVDTCELRSFATDWRDRVRDHELLTDGVSVLRLAEQAGATLIGYQPLRNLMRE